MFVNPLDVLNQALEGANAPRAKRPPVAVQGQQPPVVVGGPPAPFPTRVEPEVGPGASLTGPGAPAPGAPPATGYASLPPDLAGMGSPAAAQQAQQGAPPPPLTDSAWRTLTAPQNAPTTYKSVGDAQQALGGQSATLLQMPSGAYAPQGSYGAALAGSSNAADQLRYFNEAVPGMNPAAMRTRMQMSGQGDQADQAIMRMLGLAQGAADQVGKGDTDLAKAGVAEYATKVGDPLKILGEIEKAKVTGEYGVRAHEANQKGLTQAALTQGILSGVGDISRLGKDELQQKVDAMTGVAGRIGEGLSQNKGAAPAGIDTGFGAALQRSNPYLAPAPAPAQRPVSVTGAPAPVAVQPGGATPADQKLTDVASKAATQMPMADLLKTVLGIDPKAPVDYAKVKQAGVGPAIQNLAGLSPDQINDDHIGQVMRYLVQSGIKPEEVRSGAAKSYINDTRALDDGGGKYKIGQGAAPHGSAGGYLSDMLRGYRDLSLVGPDGQPVLQGREGVGLIPDWHELASGTMPLLPAWSGKGVKSAKDRRSAAERLLDYSMRPEYTQAKK